jgi:Ca2+-binding RTX toxin-like protein
MRLKGTKAADQLHGAVKDDVISGLGGDDQITGEGGSDQILGGAGNDNLSGDGVAWAYPSMPTPGIAGDDTLDGGAGADYLFGGSGDDLLIGGTGADQLTGGAGSDTYKGGTGDDYYNDDDYAYPVPAPTPTAALVPPDGGVAPDVGPVGEPLDHDLFVFAMPKGAGGFGHDQISGFDLGSDQIRFVGYTEADLVGSVQTVTDWSWDPNYYGSYSSHWQFDFQDGSRVTVSLYDSTYDESGMPIGTEPVAGRDYVFA